MKIPIIIGIMIMMTMSSTAFGVVLVFLDKDVYEIPTPDNPLTVFIESPGKVTISVSNGDVATVLGDTDTGEFTIYHDDYNFIEGTMLIANHINDYTLKETLHDTKSGLESSGKENRTEHSLGASRDNLERSGIHRAHCQS